MARAYPQKVLISGGHEIGGVASFAANLGAGFRALGIAAEIVPPEQIFTRLRELRDPAVLKILSTSAVFAAPIARRAICMAHGFPRADAQGWLKVFGILTSYKLACRSAKLVEVSHYASVHLRAIFNLRVDAVIHNPLSEVFLEPWEGGDAALRDTLAYVGRLHRSKGLDRFLPAIRAVLDENPGLRACIVGDGEMRAALETAAGGDPRIEFTGALSQAAVRERLRRSRVFISGCETEALGIAYLEALSQGCAVVMPACGGGLEIAPESVGRSIHLFLPDASGQSVIAAIRRALAAPGARTSLAAYAPRVVAEAFLAADRIDASRQARAQR